MVFTSFIIGIINKDKVSSFPVKFYLNNLNKTKGKHKDSEHWVWITAHLTNLKSIKGNVARTISSIMQILVKNIEGLEK